MSQPVSLAHEIGKKLRTKDVIISEDITFEGMNLSKHTLEGLGRCGFARPSPVQLKALPLGRCGFDLIVEGKSGTGKTLVFSIVALEMIDVTQGLQAIVVAPTREIAIQISDVISSIGYYYKGLNVSVVTGGTMIKNDKRLFSDESKPVHILIASPGRLRHLISTKVIQTQSVRLLILDEADKLLTKSFVEDINFFNNVLPVKKQIIATSATYTEDIREFLARYMNLPYHIRPDLSSILLGINQYVVNVKHHENTLKQITIKFDELKKILSSLPFNQCLIFCNYQSRAKQLCDSLKKENWPVSYLAGDQSQEERVKGLRNLQTFSCRILVATDLAARGLDAANVDLVINFDKPFELPTYLHRIGRAGRYGSLGNAVTILCNNETTDFFLLLNKLSENIQIENLWDGKLISLDDTADKNIPLDVENIWGEVSSEILNIMVENKIDNKNDIEEFDSLVKSMDAFEIKNENFDTYESIDSIIESLNNFQDNNVTDVIPQFNISNEIPPQLANISSHVKLVLQPAKIWNKTTPSINEIVQTEKQKKEKIQIEDFVINNGDLSTPSDGGNVYKEKNYENRACWKKNLAMKKSNIAVKMKNREELNEHINLSANLTNEFECETRCSGTNRITSDRNTDTCVNSVDNNSFSSHSSRASYTSDDSSESLESDSESSDYDISKMKRNRNSYYLKQNSLKYTHNLDIYNCTNYNLWRFNLAIQTEFLQKIIFIKEICQHYPNFNSN